jgi:hypothetical protein
VESKLSTETLLERLGEVRPIGLKKVTITDEPGLFPGLDVTTVRVHIIKRYLWHVRLQ